MNDDYLWDKTGEPDPEILELEQVLGTLRYQPRSLEIPETFHIGRKRTFFPSFAIAAAIALMITGVGLWLVLRNQSDAIVRSPTLKEGRVIQETDSQPKSLAPSNTNSSKELVASSDGLATKLKRQVQGQPTSGISKPALARYKSRGRRLVETSSELTASERAEARIAKEQLLLALRVASSKLSLAQRKAQGTYPANLIRNQHKVG